jgi:hypothetical protein
MIMHVPQSINQSWIDLCVCVCVCVVLAAADNWDY